MIRSIVVCVVLLWLSGVAHAQVPAIKNPSAVSFNSADHALVTGYEIDVISSTGMVLQTMLMGKGTQDASGTVTLILNLQPIAFGTYTLRARAVVGTTKSVDSLPSDPFERAPGQPSKPTNK